MKIYKIKLTGADLYVRGVCFEASNNEVKLSIIPAFEDNEIGIFPEDKARKYCEELNKQNEDCHFILEEVTN